MLTDPGRVPLGARRWIGDGTRGGLVTADGTLDWWTPERVEGVPALYRLLDPGGPAVRIGPVRTGTGVGRRLPAGTQRYRPGSMVVETTIDGAGGRVLVVDALPWPGPGLDAPGRVVRLVTALAGPVEVEIEVLTGPVGGRARRVSVWDGGMRFGSTLVRTGCPLLADPLGRDLPRWRAVRRLEPGEAFVVTVDDPRRDDHRPLSVDAAARVLDDTTVAWRSWSALADHDGPYRDAVGRSLLAVRALTGPGGGPLAAGTTSLPRRAGGERTADGRVVRLRDAAAAASTWASVGLAEDAEAAERWLREAVESATLPWPAALTAAGSTPPEVEEWPLPGWRRSQPVVVGVAAVVDHDLFGDVATAVSASQVRPGTTRPAGPGPLVGATPALRAGADWLADHWEAPDAGVWASQGRPVRLVASAVQAWTALDASARLARAGNPLDMDALAWHVAARGVLGWLEGEAMGADLSLGRDATGAATDAALLRIAWRGPFPTAHPVVPATVGRILERLGSGGLIERVSDDADDGLPGPDSPDLQASLWAVRALARLGRWEEAHERMETVVGLCPDGTAAEAADPTAGELLGNLPATGVHLALVDAAVALGPGPR